MLKWHLIFKIQNGWRILILNEKYRYMKTPLHVKYIYLNQMPAILSGRLIYLKHLEEFLEHNTTHMFTIIYNHYNHY